MSSVKKLHLLESMISSLSRHLGRLPSFEEVAKEAKSAGLQNLANTIFKSSILFVSDERGEELITVPDSSQHRCSDCLSYDDWKLADADWEDDRKFFRFVCQSQVNDALGFSKCGGEVTIYKE